ncbi:glycosyltransferase [Desulfovibrio sulfodismutans]|uniref:Glycosyltransferase n=1 Tax=Desulfolutivibrio sulfodismutans TaxID=63561 RepID=A0A7K3NMU5_9BACT|nr:glycosyltransferase family 2 protein [Desulfolutivibrio sulfodismutans]NDY57143.1 glycosyltransferase [Desulfolutivibrio sulfodismutans]
MTATVSAPPGPLPPLPELPPDILSRLATAMPVWAVSSEHAGVRLSMVRSLLSRKPLDRGLAHAVAGSLFWAWQEDPLDPQVTSALLELDAAMPFLPAPARALAAALLPRLAVPADPDLWEAVAACDDADMVRVYLDKATADPAHGLFRLRKALGALIDAGDMGRLLRVLAGSPIRDFPPLLERLCAEAAFFCESPDKALRRLSRLERELWGHLADALSAALLAREGDTGAALGFLAPLGRAMPWHVNLTLVRHDLACGPRPAAPPSPGDIHPGEAAVLLYTWNKAGFLRDTLENLARTRLGPAPVIVLDNGSTDDTPQVLAQAAMQFAPGQFSTVTLPVNVGAPAARNWLLSLPAVRCARYAAFVDDDARPPRDWLTLLLDAARANPQAGAVGCAVADIPAPHRLQSADYHLLPPETGQSLLAEVPERIFVMDTCAGKLDFGMYRYRRPALSVSGCCHLIANAAVRAAGPFDIRFTPTQFDDLERDMRSWLAGFPAVYEGRCVVHHVQTSSLARAKTTAQSAHVAGNKLKLEGALAHADIGRLCSENYAVLWKDLQDKNEALREVCR